MYNPPIQIKSMKKAINSVKVSLVPRKSIPSNFNSYEITPDIEHNSNHQSIRNQPFEKRISKSATSQPEVHQQKRISVLETPRNIRLDYIKETNKNNQHPLKISSLPSPSLSLHSQKYITKAQEQTTNNLHQIPTISKWSTRKKVLVGVSASLIIASLITVTTVLAVLLTKSKGSTNTTTTTASSAVISAYWAFDNTANDLYGVYNGQLINNPTYTPSGSTNLPYVGHGQALILNLVSNQSVLVSTPFFNLSYTSFTIEAWIYFSGASGADRGIFGQCQCSTCANQCLYFIIRNFRLYIDFTSNYLSGSTTFLTSNWYHIAFVYNYDTRQQILYVNGIQDTIKSNTQPYQGQNGSIQIGSTQVYSTMNFFQGYIDNVALTTRAKSSIEILRDASLMAYYSFDLPNPNVDNGPNGLDGTSSNIITATGRVNEAIRLLGPSSSSYFRAYGLFQIRYGVISNKTFSIAMWLNPSSTGSSAIIQMLPSSYTSSSCETLLGIYSYNSGTAGQLYVVSSISSPSLLTGPFIAINTWTHITLTYSYTNGYTLYVNGVLFGSTGSISCAGTGTLANLYIGFGYNCFNSYINSAYQGYIDELYIYNRELSQSDVTSLANP
ncbi:unnamed protein product [Rotaria sp. Silwood1]|nr:unnamed protein product [Rotaria sp. Silwood1]CAF1596450.1 unnamed protein product [Rotaria sp. Silwood1]CAF3677092.1 unnamed protein product [Rotaria sp. Silwood1]CAF4544541.1 unnamed protein product [Rotaria sp. Silwood1]